MNDLQVFNYSGNAVRTVQQDGEPWFVLKDVCDVLEISNSRMAADRLDADELMSVKLTSGGQLREMQIVNESGHSSKSPFPYSIPPYTSVISSITAGSSRLAISCRFASPSRRNRSAISVSPSVCAISAASS